MSTSSPTAHDIRAGADLHEQNRAENRRDRTGPADSMCVMTQRTRTSVRRCFVAAFAIAGLGLGGALATADSAEAATRGQSVYASTCAQCQGKLSGGILGAEASGRSIVYVWPCEKNTQSPAGWNNYTASYHWWVPSKAS